MASFRVETQEFIDAFSDVGTVADRAHRIAREGFDLVGKVVNLENDLAAIEEAKDELADAATAIARKLLVGRPMIRMAVLAGIPSAIGPIVDAAARYTGTAEQFVDEHVAPRLAEWEKTIHRARIGLEG